MISEGRMLEELEELVGETVSIYGVELLESVEEILKTRIVPIPLHVGHKSIRFDIIATEEPIDFLFYDTFPMSMVGSEIEPAENLSLVEAVKMVRDLWVAIQMEKIR